MTVREIQLGLCMVLFLLHINAFIFYKRHFWVAGNRPN